MGLLAVGALVAGIVLWSRGERDVVRRYVDHLTIGDLRGAYALLSEERRRELGFEGWSEAMHTPALRRSEDLTITRTRKSSRGRGCVGAVVEVAGGETLRLTFLTLEEQGEVRIHAALTGDEYQRARASLAAEWSCEH